MNQRQALAPGSTVFSADGEKVGTARSYDGSYLIVEKGSFFPEDQYIPFDAIARATEDSAYLTVSKDEALQQGWNQKPADAVVAERSDDADGLQANRNISATADRETLTVPVYEEHLDARTHKVDAGDVTVSKRVVTDSETIEVPLTEERVRVDWREPTGEMTADGEAFNEGSIEIPISREEVEISKHTVKTGEVEVSKERDQRTQKVTGDVRREVVEVGGADMETVSQGESRGN